ncbi:tyrosine--tRNA ligase, cytoplasmic-like isoform X2 [Scylla paramamosain]|uniref:tyrosine--tRNA ligase, cytoplasmic-like isoform X2 n=1 Tax=Scylla paramamosain TaxID=85552 RepID=UPI0030830D06
MCKSAEPKMSTVKLSPERLQAIDNYFCNYSYIEGSFATHSDRVLSDFLTPVIDDLSHYVHTSRWWKHIQTFELHELQGMARTIDEILDVLGKSSKTPEMRAKEQLSLICRRLDEVIGEDRIAAVIKERPLKIYWGTATTGKPHVAYFVPMTKIADFLKAGCEVTVLLADLHAYLDNMKAPWSLIEYRTRYYKAVIEAMLKAIGVSVENLRFVQGRNYQLGSHYTRDMYRLAAMVTEHDAKKAGAEVVKQVDAPLQSGLLYPGLQALDEEYLEVDAQFGGVDQRKIFMYAEKYLPKLGYQKRSHLMNPMVPGLTGGKMSASEVDSKIDLLDSADDVARKLRGASCDPASPDNGVMAFVNYVVFPVLEMQGRPFRIDGEVYSTFEQLKEDFINYKVSGNDIKYFVIGVLNSLLQHIRYEFSKPELKELAKLAYPDSIMDQPTPQAKQEGEKPIVHEMNIDDRIQLISRNLVHPSPDSLRTVLTKTPHVLWSVSLTRPPDCCIVSHVAKLRDFLSAGCRVTVLASDVLSHLDGCQVPWDFVSNIADYYLELIKATMTVLNIAMENVQFVKGSSFQEDKEYVLDLYKMTALVTCKDSSQAISSVVKDPNLLSALLYPDMMALDEKHLHADFHYCSSKYAPVIEFAQKSLPLVGGEPCTPLISDEMPSLLNRAALTPDEEYIGLTEQESQLKKKIKSAFCEEGNVTFNPVLSLVRNVIFPWLEKEKFVVVRTEENGGNLEFDSFSPLEEMFSQKKLHPGDLKNSVLEYMKKIIQPIRKAAESPAMKKLHNLAYPPPPKKAKGPQKAAGGDEFVPSKFDMRVGKVVEVRRHPDAESLYVEKIDIGEPEPRTIVSGLVKYVPIEEMQDRMVVVLANLKPANMRGVKSAGMVLCASAGEPAVIEPLQPPQGSRPGDRIVAEGYDDPPDPVLNTKKSDALAKMLAGFRTDASLRATWNKIVLGTSNGPLTVSTLKDAPIK